MSDDRQIEVKFGADITSLLSGLKEGQESMKTAAEGMKGDLGALVESFEALGPAALAAGAGMLAFEGIKEVTDYFVESVHQTHELAEQFKTLGYATGASNEQMNQFTAAMELSGGTTADLQSLLVGMQRGIKANADALVANGVAASKAALEALPFEEYLKRVHKIADNMATPTEREQFLILALGRGGATAGAMLGEFVENLEKAKGAMIITPQAMAQMEETKRSIGELKIAQQEFAATVSGEATPVANFFRDLHTKVLQVIIDMKQAADAERGLTNAGTADAGREGMHAQGISGSGETKQHLKGAPPAGGAGADPKLAAAQDAYEKTKILLEQAVADERMTEADKTQALMEAVQTRTAAELAAAGLTAAQKLAITRQGENEIAQLQVTETNQQKAAVQKWKDDYVAAHQLAAKQAAEAGREATREALEQSKDALAQQKAVLDQQVAFGQISGAQELAQRKALIDKETAAVLAAKDAEMAAVDVKDADYVNKVQKLANQEMDIQRKAEAEKTKLNQDAENQRLQTIKGHLDGMTAGWAQAIIRMTAEHAKFTDYFKAAGMAIAQYWEQTLVQMGLDEMKKAVLSLFIKKVETSSQVPGIAALAAANAFAATCAIPMVGPALAMGAAEEAWAETMGWGMAAAEGGWDRVPSNQVALLHKNEMVLPAALAEGARQTFEQGGPGGGGGGHTFNFNGVTDASWWSHNQGNIAKVLTNLMRNGRTS